jgi:hypothetical protein
MARRKAQGTVSAETNKTVSAETTKTVSAAAETQERDAHSLEEAPKPRERRAARNRQGRNRQGKRFQK